jgi:putative chitinase
MLTTRTTDIALAGIAHTLSTKLTKAQGDVIRAIAAAADKHGVTDQRQFAYILGTAFWESGFKLIREIRAPKGSKVWQMQNAYWSSGYYGRGLSQLTWRKNYEKFGKILNIPLVSNPDLALRPEYASEILVYGMVHGSFTGLKLADFFPPGREGRWLDCRKVVNGTFHADKVCVASLRIYQAVFPERFY